MQNEQHTAQQLYRASKDYPDVQRNIERSFAVLAKHADAGRFDTERAIDLLQQNVRDAAKVYVQMHGLPLQWHRVFPRCEREGCAGLMLRDFDIRYAGSTPAMIDRELSQ
jgi:hypothetical protein